jgi:hypothetical protein
LRNGGSAIAYSFESDHQPELLPLFAIEREIKGLTPQERVRARNDRSRPLVIALESWLREQRSGISKNSESPGAPARKFAGE